MVSAFIEGWCSLPGHWQMGMVFDVVAVGCPYVFCQAARAGGVVRPS